MERPDLDRHLDGLMTLLTVARLGRFTAAGKTLGISHSTVSRRIDALERTLGGRVLVRAASGWEVTSLGQNALYAAERVEDALAQLTEGTEGSTTLTGTLRLGAPDAFAVHVATPAMARLQADHPNVGVEVISATQRARQNRTGLDLEVVVGKPEIRRATAEHVMDYALRLYATEEYLSKNGVPSEVAQLVDHRLNYYVESVLTVDELDRGTEALPRMRRGIASTNVLAHVTATVAGAGIGLLPDYVADSDERLEPVLANHFSHEVSYWAVGREEALRSPAVQAMYAALRHFSESLSGRGPA